MKVWEYPLVTQITQIFPHAKVSGEIRARLDRKVARRQEMLEAKEVLWQTDAPLRDYQNPGYAHYLNKVKGAAIPHPTLDRNIVVIMDDHDSSHVIAFPGGIHARP